VSRTRGRARIAVAAALSGVVIGSVAAVAVGATDAAAPAPARPAVSTALVVRTNLVTTTYTQGTLGYAPTDPVVNRLAGTYTAVPAPGTVVRSGQVLYSVDDAPVVLLAGSLPAWRPFTPGMTDGPDVGQLEADLVALGDAAGLFTTPSNHFGALAVDAVERWQRATGQPVTGTVGLGQVVFLPDPVATGADLVAPGQAANPGDVPFEVTTTDRVVVVPMTPSLPDVPLGEAVSVLLPDNAAVPGRVTAVGAVFPGAGASGGSGSSGASSGGSSSAGSSSGGSSSGGSGAEIEITPNHPAATGTGTGVAVQVSLTTSAARDVLAVPISALLALSGGGYGLEVVEPSGTHHLVAVTTGTFTATKVEVSGRGVLPGLRVVVAQ
jgi:uncharacterized membrane protein YgcG